MMKRFLFTLVSFAAVLLVANAAGTRPVVSLSTDELMIYPGDYRKVTVNIDDIGGANILGAQWNFTMFDEEGNVLDHGCHLEFLQEYGTREHWAWFGLKMIGADGTVYNNGTFATSTNGTYHQTDTWDAEGDYMPVNDYGIENVQVTYTGNYNVILANMVANQVFTPRMSCPLEAIEFTVKIDEGWEGQYAELRMVQADFSLTNGIVQLMGNELATLRIYNGGTVPPPMFLTGDILIGEVSQDGLLPIYYYGPEEEVYLTVVVNGEEVPVNDGMIQLPGYGVHTIVAIASAEGYEELYNEFEVLWPEPECTEPPIVLVAENEDGSYTITAEGKGEVILYVNGEPVDNPYIIMPCDETMTYIYYATAQEDDKLMSMSDTGTLTVEAISYHNMLYMPDTTAHHGTSIVIPVRLDNEQAITAFQTDIYLPEGFSILTNEIFEPIITPSSRLTNDHVIMADRIDNGAVRVICYNPMGRPINGNEGDLFYITVQVPANAGGDYAITLRNNHLTNIDYIEVTAPDATAKLTVTTYTPGDVNDNGTVNVTDIVLTAQYLLQRNPEPFIFEAADMNGDGIITVTDIMLIARLIMTPTMTAPKQAPVLAVNDDSMSAADIMLQAGETQRVSIMLDNDLDYCAFQLDLNLPDGLTASNFALTDRAGSHSLDVEALGNGKVRVLCFSQVLDAINGNSGALLTFDVTAHDSNAGDIMVDGIELVTTDFRTVRLNPFAFGAQATTAVNEVATGKAIARVDYFNLAGQRIVQPENGAITLVVTTYTDGTTTAAKIKQP